VELARPLAVAAVAALPMAAVVFPVRDQLVLALPLGAAVQLATLLLLRRRMQRANALPELRYP
jgi:hypothetical protein